MRLGIARHWYPVPSMNWIPLKTSCMSRMRGSPTLEGGGMSRSITDRSAVVKSVSYLPIGHLYCI